MNTRNILTNADSLKRKNPVLPQLTKEINRLLMDINAKIEDANKTGVVIIYYNLPIIFKNVECSYLSNSEIQKYIYDKIISSLEQKNFDVRIRTEQTETLLKISWKMELYDKKESEDVRNRLLRLQF